VLDGFNLDVGAVRYSGFLGPNGAGKTTLIKSIIGLINIKRGSIELFAQPYLSNRAKLQLGYTPEIAN